MSDQVQTLPQCKIVMWFWTSSISFDGTWSVSLYSHTSQPFSGRGRAGLPEERGPGLWLAIAASFHWREQAFHRWVVPWEQAPSSCLEISDNPGSKKSYCCFLIGSCFLIM